MPDETCEEYISRIQQLACDDNIPSLMLINLIAKGFKTDIAEKVLDKDPETFEDLFKFAKRAESTIKLRNNNPLIASIEGMEDRLMDKLSKQLESTVMALTNQQNSPSPARFEEKSQGRDHRDRYQGYRANNFQPRNNFHGNRQYQNSGPQYRERPRPAHGTHGNRFPRPAHQSRDTSSQHSNRPSQFQHPPGPSKCSNCFMDTCDKVHCIALGKQCYYCNGYNHFQIACVSNPNSPFYQYLANFESNHSCQ